MSNSGCLTSFWVRSTVEPAQGTTVNATISEASRLKVIVSAISVSSSRTMPVEKIIGKNTQMVVRVEEMMEPDTCRAP